MTRSLPRPMPLLPAAARRGALALLAAAALAGGLPLALSGCGGGDGYTPSPLALTDRRALPTDFTHRVAINYSPYRTSRSEADLAGEVITAAHVLQDLRLLQAAGIGTIRLFSSRLFARTVLEVIRDHRLDLKVMLGAYPNPPVDAAAEAVNQAELDAAIALANAHPTIVAAVSVGNETMVSWSTHKIDPAVMAGYLRRVRAAIAQPVTTDDNWAFWASVPKVITDVVDFAAVHTYPLLDTFYDPTLFDWRLKSVAAAARPQAMVDAAIAEAKRQFGQARQGLDRLGLESMPMVIGETGWVAVDTAGGPDLSFRAHPVNQKLYFDALQAWAAEGRRGRGPQAIFVFQAFDEPWKQGDDGWGLFNAARQARYTVQGLGTCGVTWVCEPGSYTAASAVSWVAPVVNAPVDAPRYTLFADRSVAGERRATGLRWDPFAATGYAIDGGDAAPADPTASLKIAPNPETWGWGLFQRAEDDGTVNLSAFAGGRLAFSIRTDAYPGRLELGITSDTEDRAIQEAWVRMGPGDFGHCNTDAWCVVSVPIAAFQAANPALDLRLVKFRFVIADRFAMTGKPPGTRPLPSIRIDDLRWER